MAKLFALAIILTIAAFASSLSKEELDFKIKERCYSLASELRYAKT